MGANAVIVCTVENLSMSGAKPVEILLMEIFSRTDSAGIADVATCG
jgi:hypothetical protein